jgi:hypothetical protein
MLAASASAAILFDNGPWITGYGDGYNGADTSALEAGYTAMGYNVNIALVQRYSMADDFTVPANEAWSLEYATLYAYQANSGLNSTITGAYVTIYDGNPMTGGQVLWGDEVTNRLISTTWSGVYRVSTVPTNAQRPIMVNLVDMRFISETLGPGTYWLGFSITGSSGLLGPHANPVVPHRESDNAVYRMSGAWSPADGNGPSGGTPPQDFPFILEGDVIPEPANLIVAGLLALLARRR